MRMTSLLLVVVLVMVIACIVPSFADSQYSVVDSRQKLFHFDNGVNSIVARERRHKNVGNRHQYNNNKEVETPQPTTETNPAFFAPNAQPYQYEPIQSSVEKLAAEENPYRVQKKVEKLLELRSVSGSLFVAILFASLSIRNMALLQVIEFEYLLYPMFHLPTKIFTVGLLVCNILAGIAMVANPTKAKTFGKFAFVLNIFREIVAFFTNMYSTIMLLLAKQNDNAQMMTGQLLANAFWAVTLLTISRTRWISPAAVRQRQHNVNRQNMETSSNNQQNNMQ